MQNQLSNPSDTITAAFERGGDLAVRYDSVMRSRKTVSPSFLQAYKKQADFDYYEQATTENAWDQFKSWIGSLFRSMLQDFFDDTQVTGFLRVFFEVLPYILAAIILYLLIWFFMKVNLQGVFKSAANPNKVFLSEEENIIKNQDIDQLIQQALQQQAYRLAIRYSYLAVLKSLTTSQHIVWELQKTNDDYQRELQNTSLANAFATITKSYDYFWYGEFPIDQATYQRVEKDFITLKNTIKSHA